MKIIYQLLHNHFIFIFLHKYRLLITTHSHDFVCSIAVFCCYGSLFYYLLRFLAVNCYVLSDEMIFSFLHHFHYWNMSLNLTEQKDSGFIPQSNILGSTILFSCATHEWVVGDSKGSAARVYSGEYFWTCLYHTL